MQNRNLPKLIVALFVLAIGHFTEAQTPSPFLHVDQFGYFPMAEKVAVLSDPVTGYNSQLAYSPPANLSLRRSSDDVVVWTGAPQAWNGGTEHSQSGDRGWWLDFSNFTMSGSYYVYDAANNQRSADFTISDAVYNEVVRQAGRMFYYNRCNLAKTAAHAGNAWTDAISFTHTLQDANCRYVYDPGNASLERDLTGGWFDAGDYNKYVTFAHSAVHDLLWAYRDNPGVFTDAWNIPESGNGIPDLLDEIKWETDWLLKMINADSSVIIKMGSINFQNAGSPPSSNTLPRFYGPTCTSAAIAMASMLAHAATVFGDVPAWSAYAQTLETAAEKTFAYFLTRLQTNTLETDCDDGTINAGDADRTVEDQKHIALTAAAYLYELTGDAQYETYLISHLTDASSINNTWWDPYLIYLHSALLNYAALPTADAVTSQTIRNSFATAAQNNWNGFFGFNAADLYRGYMPDWSYHWGSNSPKAGYGVLNHLLVKYGLNSGQTTSYQRATNEILHYFHGVNPLGLVMLSNMYDHGAEHSVDQIYHNWFADGTVWDDALTSLYGPPPGYVTGGPNQDFSIGSLSPPTGQPAMKSYLDFNDHWPLNSWEISEPAIYYQASYLRLLANQATNALVLPVVYTQPLTATERDGQITVTWWVSEEIDADYYAVEHLSSTNVWQELGRLSANGQSSYTFLHTTPHTGANYYRLRQLDVDGAARYTNIVMAVVPVAAVSVHCYPVPVTGDRLTLEGAPIGASVRVIDVRGQQLAHYIVDSAPFTLSTRHWPTGHYALEIRQADGTTLWSNVVQK